MSENDWPLDDALTSPVHKRNDWPPADWGESLISMPVPDAMRPIGDGAPLFDFGIESLTFDEAEKIAAAAYPQRAVLVVRLRKAVAVRRAVDHAVLHLLVDAEEPRKEGRRERKNISCFAEETLCFSFQTSTYTSM